ncbi:hypothetical protein CABS01_02420 [Colletotrichum abscissum]|uniref:Uncharacterized protein n=1 Tax=Colletotrichum abscissum TaxID=1671311 RepID=A0A9P9XRV0_9PEZI|nr:uncharacterized protein CABS01_02420 [Colletotrichum abscissum]KAI3559195.1 hypothetical protein CABS02_00170 [Colletotrichum abscissum]KAK1488790.1 hypothetical protein CABS01_02420 [Colletotrichum abscissum]
MGTSPGDYLTDSGPAARWDLRRARSDLDGLVGSHDMEGGTGLVKGSRRVTRATHIMVHPPAEYLTWGAFIANNQHQEEKKNCKAMAGQAYQAYPNARQPCLENFPGWSRETEGPKPTGLSDWLAASNALLSHNAVLQLASMGPIR